MQALAYAALDEAEVAFERLGSDEGLIHFLLSGFDSTSDEVVTACREVAATIGLCPRVYAVGTAQPFEVYCCARGGSRDGGRR
jgi:hypothetical protein